MPKDALEVLKRALYKGMEDPKVAKTAESTGLRFEFRKQEEFTKFAKEYSKLIEMIVREPKITKS